MGRRKPLIIFIPASLSFSLYAFNLVNSHPFILQYKKYNPPVPFNLILSLSI